MSPTSLQLSSDDMELLGVYEALETETGFRTTYPQRARKENQVHNGSTFVKFYDPDTGATITIPADAFGGD